MWAIDRIGVAHMTLWQGREVSCTLQAATTMKVTRRVVRRTGSERPRTFFLRAPSPGYPTKAFKAELAKVRALFTALILEGL